MVGVLSLKLMSWLSSQNAHPMVESLTEGLLQTSVSVSASRAFDGVHASLFSSPSSPPKQDANGDRNNDATLPLKLLLTDWMEFHVGCEGRAFQSPKGHKISLLRLSCRPKSWLTPLDGMGLSKSPSSPSSCVVLFRMSALGGNVMYSFVA